MNLIPDEIKNTGNYFCTWDSQCDTMHTRVPKPEGLSSRDAMNEEFLFGREGILNSFDGVRGDLIVVLDDGWDVPYGATDRRLFGSLEADEQRFPSLKDLSPAGRLKALSEKVRSLGYRGLGLWVPTQTPSLVNGKEIILTPQEERLYWEERARWCREAGVIYIKADWGAHQGDADYCVMMTDCFRKYAPGLCIEHGLVGRPLFESEENGSGVPAHVSEYLRRVLPVSDYLRTYDVVHELKYASTVDRVSVCLAAAKDIAGDCAVLNIEDTALIGAALGCAIGVMRHDYEKKRKYLPLSPRLVSETVCALRWQRIAPPFAANTGELNVSSQRLKDVWHCPERSDELWPNVPEGDYYVTAPSSVSRNMPLPEVTAKGDLPYVLCSVHPVTGALCVAATPRTSGTKIDIVPLADVRVKGGSPSAPIGVFGRFDSFTADFDESVEGKRVFAQSLLSDTAHEVTELVSLRGRTLTVPGSVIMQTGMPENRENGIPAVVIELK